MTGDAMSETIENPFRITKSNNLTDEQIDSLWVTPDSHEETSSYFRPTSSMAMFILGGNTMLSPRYDLPIARRGVVPLSPSDVNASILFPVSKSYSKETSTGIQRVWRYTLEFPIV